MQRNLPQENPSTNDGKQSNEENRKQEELTNYELSSKTISTVSGGYGIDNLSVAVLVNRASLLASLGGTPTPEAVERRMSELQQLVATAAGTRSERGPEDLLAMLREKLAAFSGAIDFSLDNSDRCPDCCRSNKDRIKNRSVGRAYKIFAGVINGGP